MNRRPYTSLYVHVPFCHGKCGYCAFYSLGTFSEDLPDAYLVHLEDEFHENAPACATLNSVFIGGGTPSVLDCRQLERLLEAIRRNFRLSRHCEWSMECNPESMTPEKITLAREMGVNRFSLGIQNFTAKMRSTLMRNGNLDSLEKIIDAVHCGTSPARLNLDLIFGIPGQTINDWRYQLESAMRLNPDHLSTYALTIEEGTPLAKKHTCEIDDDTFCDFWNTTDEILNSHGLTRYEVSNFSRPGCRCIHNNDVWHGATYLGCGPAAVSFNGIDRISNPKSLNAWLANAPQEHDVLSDIERAREIFAFGMRTTIGWYAVTFEKITGFTPADLYGDTLEKLERANLISILPSSIRPTKFGLLFNDDVLGELI